VEATVEATVEERRFQRRVKREINAGFSPSGRFCFGGEPNRNCLQDLSTKSPAIT
jgi:hypothetical protein